ncbi:MAG: IMP cyclohydrolase [Desulfosudis oleivorans]|nr:IMP cyclohydrolase [Desulfosudis oleivorans]
MDGTEPADAGLRQGQLGHRRRREGPALRREPRARRPRCTSWSTATSCSAQVENIQPGRYLASNAELLQSGKHPGKTNITDADNALNILRYFTDRPTRGDRQAQQPLRRGARRQRCWRPTSRPTWPTGSRPSAAAIACNRPVDRATAEAIAEQYAEVVVAPEFEEGVMDIFGRKKNLRVMRIANMDAPAGVRRQRRSWTSRAWSTAAMIAAVVVRAESPAARRTCKPAECDYKGKTYRVKREPDGQRSYEDLLFGWLVEAGVTSNSVIYVKDQVTVGIGTGEQDRVGVAEIARDKAYRKLADRYCFEAHGIAYNDMQERRQEGRDRRAGGQGEGRADRRGHGDATPSSPSATAWTSGIREGDHAR